MRVQIRMLLIRTASSQSKLAAYANQPFHSFIFCFIFHCWLWLSNRKLWTQSKAIVCCFSCQHALFQAGKQAGYKKNHKGISHFIDESSIPVTAAAAAAADKVSANLTLTASRELRYTADNNTGWQRQFQSFKLPTEGESEREGEKERERVCEKSMAAIHRWRLLTEISARMGAKPHSFRPQQPDRPHWWQDIYKPSFWNVALSPSIRSI